MLVLSRPLVVFLRHTLNSWNSRLTWNCSVAHRKVGDRWFPARSRRLVGSSYFSKDEGKWRGWMDGRKGRGEESPSSLCRQQIGAILHKLWPVRTDVGLSCSSFHPSETNEQEPGLEGVFRGGLGLNTRRCAHQLGARVCTAGARSNSNTRTRASTS